MKLLAFILLFGLASAASIYEYEEADEYVLSVLEELEEAPLLRDHLFRRDEALSELNIRDVLLQIREHLKKNVDPELIKEKLEKLFGEGSELLNRFLQLLKEKSKNKLMILIDLILDEDENAQKSVAHGIKDYWEKVKDYFKDLKIDLQEKYMKFGEWVKNTFDKGMENSKDRLDNIKAIAKEFAKHAKGISKEVAIEAGEFFKAYKDELGNLWDEIKEKVQEIKDRKD